MAEITNYQLFMLCLNSSHLPHSDNPNPVYGNVRSFMAYILCHKLTPYAKAWHVVAMNAKECNVA